MTMSQDNAAEAPAPVANKKKANKKTEASKLYPNKLDKKAKATQNDFEFVGRVESINVKGAGANSNQFLFSLVDKKGSHNSYLLDPSEPLRLSAMASLLTAASASGAKVKVRSAPNADGPNFAGELEVRNKG
jgi:hypothetical protein